MVEILHAMAMHPILMLWLGIVLIFTVAALKGF